MLTTLVASSKGGCGKTTLVTQLATHWAQSGKHTAIIDADRQHSSLRWVGRRPENVPAVTAVEGSRKAFDRLPGDTQRTIVDTPELPVDRRGTNPVQPATAVRVTWRGESGTRELFGVQAIATPLRRVATFRQCSFEGLCPKFVAKSVLITERADSPQGGRDLVSFSHKHHFRTSHISCARATF